MHVVVFLDYQCPDCRRLEGEILARVRADTWILQRTPKENPLTAFLLQQVDLTAIPGAEDERFEYKASTLSNIALKEKLVRAASGFWNSGGGTFVAGVNGSGKPDGGLPMVVGKTPLRDWVDQVLLEVAPVGTYAVHLFTDDPALPLNIAPNHCVLAVSFGPSHRPPHMAPDNRYYIRAGAHTVPASHYLVEALWAKRVVQRPQLGHTMRMKPEMSEVVQLVILALTDQPALNVTLSLHPLPSIWKNSESAFPLKLPVLDRSTPFHLDITTFYEAEERLGKDVELRIEYEDLAGSKYPYSAWLDVRSIAPWRLGTPASETMAKSLESMEKSLSAVPKALEELQREGAELRGRFEAFKYAAFPQQLQAANELAARLSPDAAAVMRQAAGNGTIVFSAYIGGFQMSAGKRPFLADPDDREVARWKSVLVDLCQRGLIDGLFRRSGSSIFRFTNLGYNVADCLKEKNAESSDGESSPAEASE